MISGDVFNKKWSLDSAVQIIQQSNKSNNESTCTTGSTCNTSSLINITGIMATSMAPMMMLQSSVSTVNHFYDHYDTSNNHTILAPNELDVDSGGATSQAKYNGPICLTVAISAVCLVFSTCLIHFVHAIGLRYV